MRTQPQSARTRVQTDTVNNSGLDVEYHDPTSTQTENDNNVRVIESDIERA